MTLPPSASEGASSFTRLHVEVQRWIRDQGWTELRDVQDQAIRAVLDTEADVLITASTAAGKTEAAFLPILTRVVDRSDKGLSVLYVSPLKALINDQFRRLDLLCERMEIDVVRWHGDAPQSAKTRTLKNPSGIALITPESIEALFLRRTTDAKNLLSRLDFILIDELHAFLQGPRGLHLASLLRRVDALSGKRARRVGLSATIGDPELAMAWMNPTAPTSVRKVESAVDAPELRLQIRGYVEPKRGPRSRSAPPDGVDEDSEITAFDQIADHAFSVLRGSNNLFFGGSRKNVEAMADKLRRRSEAANVPNEFFPHHGNISKELREELELRLKAGDLPTTAVSTTTLELGIDIGSVKSVAMLGAPRSLASLRQRLGRSGRRKGVPAILRAYVTEAELAADSHPRDRLRLDTIRAVAAIRLLVEKFVEPPRGEPSLYTVLLHQTLSLIVQRGGARADVLYKALCAEGPFSSVSSANYAVLLRAMASAEARLIEQASDGTIMLGEVGETISSRRDFYAVFETDEEWRIVASGRTLGTIPLSNTVAVGGLFIFAGRRWRIEAVDDRAKVLEVSAHRSGQIPQFEPATVEGLDDRLTREMRQVYLANDLPSYLNPSATAMLVEGRTAFGDLGLDRRTYVGSERDTILFTWRGTAMNSVLAILLISAGLECEPFDVGVTVADSPPDEINRVLASVKHFPTAAELSSFATNLRSAKFDDFVPDDLLQAAWAKRMSGFCEELPAECDRLARTA